MDKFTFEGKHKTYSFYRGVYTPIESNMYIFIEGNEALVIDPNVNNEVSVLFERNDIRKVYLLLTHEHYDHTNGVIWFKEHFDSMLICNKVCADIVSIMRKNTPRLVSLVLADKDRKDGGNRYEEFKKSYVPFKLDADIIYDAPCHFSLLGMKFEGFQTPGHSPGSWCLLVDNEFVITGDTLIKDTPVILRFSEGRENEFKAITLPFLKSLDSELMVLPGHFDPFVLKDNNILDTYV